MVKLPYSSRVCAIIATRKPNVNQLTVLLTNLDPQVFAIVLVDCSGDLSLQPMKSLLDNLGVTTVELSEKTCHAAAQNEGIVWAKSQNATHVLLLEQNSLPDEEMVARLLWADQCLRAEGIKIAAVGPQHIDPKTDDAPKTFTQKGRFGKKRIYPCTDKRGFSCVDELCESGYLIHTACFDDVGLIPESDCMISWAKRAHQKGYLLYGVHNAFLQYQMSE